MRYSTSMPFEPPLCVAIREKFSSPLIRKSGSRSQRKRCGWKAEVLQHPSPLCSPIPVDDTFRELFATLYAIILPPDHNFLPTLRIAQFAVADWLSGDHACDKMKELLRSKNV